MTEKVKVKVKVRKGTGKLMSCFVVLTIVLSLFTASVAMVSADPPQPPEHDLLVTAYPETVLADGVSTSTITATVINGTSGEPIQQRRNVYFAITDGPGILTELGDSSNTGQSIIIVTDETTGNATALINATEIGTATILARLTDPSVNGSVEVEFISEEDTTAPEITNVASSAITTTTATITWDTDEDSDSLVKYGTTQGGPYTEQEYNAADVMSHNIGLMGLAANTTYYYVVNSTDPSDNPAESGENSFTTLETPDETPPEISNVASSAITTTTATITWDTNEVSDSLVKYGTTQGGPYTDEEYNAADVMAHSVGLTGLTANTTYYYVVDSTDPSDNPAESAEYSFTTLDGVAGSIFGTVTEGDGTTPIEGATVNVTQDGTLVAQTSTNETGAYLITGLLASSYNMTVYKTYPSKPSMNCAPNTTTVVVVGGDTTVSNVKLRHIADMYWDGDVNMFDLNILATAWGTCEGDPGFNPIANLYSVDTCINMFDLNIFAAEWGTTYY